MKFERLKKWYMMTLTGCATTCRLKQLDLDHQTIANYRSMSVDEYDLI